MSSLADLSPGRQANRVLPASPTATLVLPGRCNSGPEHWQSRWEAADSTFQRVRQLEWEHPHCDDWCAALEAAVAAQGHTPPILVAHSLACVMVAHWAARSRHVVKAALLVAPSNPERPDFDRRSRGFAPVPQRRLPFPSILVASSNDPRGSLEYAQACASAWGSRFVNIGPAGHINIESGLGDWPHGWALYRQLAQLPPADLEPPAAGAERTFTTRGT